MNFFSQDYSSYNYKSDNKYETNKNSKFENKEEKKKERQIIETTNKVIIDPMSNPVFHGNIFQLILKFQLSV